MSGTGTPNRASITSPSTTKQGTPAEASTEDNGSQQLAVAVDDLLDQLQHRFTNVSNEIFGKLDDMARRLDELEASLTIASEADRSN
ncbi:hypothetical protein CIHG_07029 [Coccidioides immitis H538.4]|uniref:Heat shock factor-binding protein 1 n=3 Tax=Coccidioides immitis TaxID=5501 RepID=A0A0J8RC25_COCIT|nr:hypothetical protein CIRG_08540 [Coccidioides immitis RMSCC 2394]KMU81980.1 hypothetical protein CISG_09466 [Coccidioides immitis RMSCC 3703]KMU89097.1 hypothetical protein CIHG_07029 [Coccidioides immitis H538.4]TPX20712.1 hypothetical protein DIZ76_016607 [Coccidioides immitis]